MFISVLRQLVIIVPVAYFLAKISDSAVWFAFPIAEAVALLTSIVMFIQLYNKKIKTLDSVE